MAPSTLQLLRDGLRLALLLPPKTIAPTSRFGPIIALALLGLLMSLPGTWLSVESPRQFNPDGFLTWLATLSLTVLSAAALARWVKRQDLTLTITGWLLAAMLVLDVAHAVMLQLMPEDAFWPAYLVIGCWLLALCLRLALALNPHLIRVLVGGVAAALIMLLPWWVMDAPEIIETDWMSYYDELGNDDTSRATPDAELAVPELTMYAQKELLDAALADLAPERPGEVDLYAIGFAGDAEEGAFRNEVEFLPQLLAHRFDNPDRTIRLINHVGSAARVPLATVTNLERALAGIAERMDLEQDILLLYLTSHGSEDHLLYVNQPPLPLRQLSPSRLRVALDEAGIRWRVIVVSACYSGGFIEPLTDSHTVIITAAREDRTSFGCGNTANATWFGQAFLIDGLNHSLNFRRAFLRARHQIAEREQSGDHEPSEPQWQAGADIAGHLARWSNTLPERDPVVFVPSVPVVDVDGAAAAPAHVPEALEQEAEPAR